MRRLGASALLALVLPGCALWAAIRSPGAEADVSGLTLSVDGTSAGLLQLQLELENGRNQTVQLREVRWELWLRRRRFASGLATRAEVSPEQGLVRILLEAPLVYPGGSDPRTGLAEARVHGNVTVLLGGVERTFAFAHRTLLTVGTSARALPK